MQEMTKKPGLICPALAAGSCLAEKRSRRVHDGPCGKMDSYKILLKTAARIIGKRNSVNPAHLRFKRKRTMEIIAPATAQLFTGIAPWNIQ